MDREKSDHCFLVCIIVSIVGITGLVVSIIAINILPEAPNWALIMFDISLPMLVEGVIFAWQVKKFDHIYYGLSWETLLIRQHNDGHVDVSKPCAVVMDDNEILHIVYHEEDVITV